MGGFSRSRYRVPSRLRLDAEIGVRRPLPQLVEGSWSSSLRNEADRLAAAGGELHRQHAVRVDLFLLHDVSRGVVGPMGVVRVAVDLPGLIDSLVKLHIHIKPTHCTASMWDAVLHLAEDPDSHLYAVGATEGVGDISACFAVVVAGVFEYRRANGTDRQLVAPCGVVVLLFFRVLRLVPFYAEGADLQICDQPWVEVLALFDLGTVVPKPDIISAYNELHLGHNECDFYVLLSPGHVGSRNLSR